MIDGALQADVRSPVQVRAMHHTRRILQESIIIFTRPYIARELPGWGRVYNAFVGGYRRNWLWAGAPVRRTRGKLHGYLMHLDLSRWADRVAYFLGRWYALDLQLFIADIVKPGDVVVDVGANRGMFALSAARLVEDQGRVICFEPNPQCLELLRLDVASNKIRTVEIHPCGLADRSAVATLTIPNINFGEGTLGGTRYPSDKTVSIDVPIRRGDDLLAAVRPSLIKLDIEGYEAKALAGLEETVRAHKPVIITEVAPALLGACSSSVEELMTLMARMDYKPFELGLRKRHGKYGWCLRDPNPAGNAGTDWVWFHQPFAPGVAELMNAHR